MGTEIIRETFGERDYARFRERLEQCLSDLGELLARPASGSARSRSAPSSRLCLVDGAALPLPRNQAVRDLAADPRITLDSTGQPGAERLAGPAGRRPFTALAGELGCCWPGSTTRSGRSTAGSR